MRRKKRSACLSAHHVDDFVAVDLDEALSWFQIHHLVACVTNEDQADVVVGVEHAHEKAGFGVVLARVGRVADDDVAFGVVNDHY